MKVKELIKQLKQTKENNEVRIDFGGEEKTDKEYSKGFYLSFDDVGDVLIYEVEDYPLLTQAQAKKLLLKLVKDKEEKGEELDDLKRQIIDIEEEHNLSEDNL